VQIAAEVIGAGAQPWRFTAADYRAALDTGSQRPSSAPRPLTLTTPWDPELGAAMAAGQRAVEEEDVLDLLVADLAAAAAPSGTCGHAAPGQLHTR
jgi:hypothetical protein